MPEPVSPTPAPTVDPIKALLDEGKWWEAMCAWESGNPGIIERLKSLQDSLGCKFPQAIFVRGEQGRLFTLVNEAAPTSVRVELGRDWVGGPRIDWQGHAGDARTCVHPEHTCDGLVTDCEACDNGDDYCITHVAYHF